MGKYTIVCAVLTTFILALCHAESHSARLTAFGKPNSNQNSHSNKKNTYRDSRECRNDSDCQGIQNTTCISDPRDNKMRCICRDFLSPINGVCPNMPKAVGSTCTSDPQCVERAECRTNKPSNTTGKMCLCKEGFVEHEGLCSGAIVAQGSSWMALLMAAGILLGNLLC